jgi:hypothetical protein
MRNILILLNIVIYLSNNVYSQAFTEKEEKRIKPVLKRSTSNIRNFEKTSPISIEITSYKEIEGLLENAMFNAGFNVVSNKVARESVQISNVTNNSNDTIEVSKSIKFKSIYVVTVNGSFYDGPVLGRCQRALLSFTARIVDLNDNGRLIGVFKFTGNALTFVACLEDVVNAFVYQLMQTNKNNDQ